jgi:cleavage and polyadenylation specificity factor subunit 1
MNAIRHEVLPASGVAYATTLRLTGRVPTDVVVARSNLLRVFELVEEEATAGAQSGEGQVNEVHVWPTSTLNICVL